MGSLATGLRQFYRKDKNRVIFCNAYSLNKLALQMWAELGFQGVDASVLSRIISGERLPTPFQLDVLCRLLSLSQRDKEHLFQCLNNDHLERNGVQPSDIFIASSDVAAFMNQLATHMTALLYQGECTQLLSLSEVVEGLYRKVTFVGRRSELQQSFLMAYGQALYTEGRAIGSLSTSQTVMAGTQPIVKALFSLAVRHDIGRLRGLMYSVLADAYYVAGRLFKENARVDSQRVTYLRKAIQYGIRSLADLADDDHEKLFAIRSIVASANYLGDESVITHFKKITVNLLPMQPPQNYVNALHLAGTFAHGQAMLGSRDPFAMKSFVTKYFKNTLTGTGIYELSDIKSTVEALQIVHSNDQSYLDQLLKRGLLLAQKDNYVRHRRYFERAAHGFPLHRLQDHPTKLS